MPAPDGRVSLAPFENVDDAIAVLRRRYDRMSADDPGLARNVSPADPDDVRLWHSTGQLKAIMLHDNLIGAIGVLAVAPGRVGWIDADEINEEVVDADYAGHGYASSAQRAWANRPTNHGDRMLVGTVDRLNEVSRRTAERAGRPRVLEDVFLLLP